MKKEKNALIILHEIYGMNEFIQSVCKRYEKDFDVVCPNLLKHECFPYEETEQAYQYFQEEVGFSKVDYIESMINDLKKQYKKVFLLGFSVGATLAWKCSINTNCDGVIGLYGSRIRDYTDLNPGCPILLLFANQDSFDVKKVVDELKDKGNVNCQILNGEHGFMDQYTKRYNQDSTMKAEHQITLFLKKYTT